MLKQKICKGTFEKNILSKVCKGTDKLETLFYFQDKHKSAPFSRSKGPQKVGNNVDLKEGNARKKERKKERKKKKECSAAELVMKSKPKKASNKGIQVKLLINGT